VCLELHHYTPTTSSWRVACKSLAKTMVAELHCQMDTVTARRFLLYLNSSTKPSVKGKVHPCTGTEALYRPYGP